MTREEARVLLKNLNYQLTSEFYDGGFWVEEGTFEAFEVADAALRGSQPDPDCGCGGKAGFHYSVILRDCPYCCWIDPTLLEADEVDGPLNYCRVCGRDLRVPETAQKTGQEAQDERD